MEAQDEVAALMPRTMHGRRLSNASFDPASLQAYTAAMSKLRVSQAPLANVAEEAPARTGVALWRRRSGGTGRAGAASKKPFVFKNWEAPVVAPAPPVRAEKTPRVTPVDRPRRVSFADADDEADAAENTPPVAARAPVAAAGRRGSAAPPPLFEDASPASQAYIAAARARLQDLSRADGSLMRARGAGGAPAAGSSGSGGRGFELQLRGALPAPRASPAPLDAWAAHAAPSPRGAEAAAAAARRRGAAPPKPVLVAYTPPPDGAPSPADGAAPARSRWLRDTPGRVGVAPAPLALTPPAAVSASPLSPTPTPNVSPLPPQPARAAAETQTSPLPDAAAAAAAADGFSFGVEATPAAQRRRSGPAAPVPARADAGVGPSPPVGGFAADSPVFFGGAGGDDLDAPPPPDFDDDGGDAGAGGWDDDAPADAEAEAQAQAAAAAAAAARAAKRAARPPGTPNKRLKAAMRARKSLAHAGLRVEEATGVRRSTRERMRPLEYWRNETKTYGRTHRSLPTVTAVTLRSPEPAWPAPAGWKPPRARAGRVAVGGGGAAAAEESEGDDGSDGGAGGSDSEAAPRRKAKPASKGSKRAKAAAKAPAPAEESEGDDDGSA